MNVINKLLTRMHIKNRDIVDLKGVLQSFEITTAHMFLLAILSRALFAVLAVMMSLKDEQGNVVSPLGEVSFGDYPLYDSFASEVFSMIQAPFIFFSHGGSVAVWIAQGAIPGPVLPWLLNVFDYSTHSLPLASVYLIASALLVFGWVVYYRTKKVSVWGQLALIAFPLLLWYSLAISTELPMAVGLFMFYCGALTIPRWPFWGFACAISAFIIMLLIRPNSLSLFPVMLLVIFLNRDLMSKWCAAAIVVLTGTLFMYFVVYYAPYFFHVKGSALALTYWELTQEQYFDGLFPNLPLLVNQAISNVVLIVSKIIYASGLRPSYSDVPLLFVLLRAISGILILPGIFYCFYRGSWLEKVLLLGFLLPLVVTVAQERYLLPIAPLLLLFGGMFWKDLYLWVRRRYFL